MKLWFILIILFIFAYLWRRGFLYFTLIIINWQRKHVTSLFENGEEKIGCLLGSSIFSLIGKLWSSLGNTIFIAGIIYITFWQAGFPISLSIFISVIAVLSWIVYEAILFLPPERFYPVIARLPAFMTTSKKSHRNLVFVFIGWLFLGLGILISWLQN